MQGYFYADLILSSTTGDLIFFLLFFYNSLSRRSKRLLQNFSKKAAIL